MSELKGSLAHDTGLQPGHRTCKPSTERHSNPGVRDPEKSQGSEKPTLACPEGKHFCLRDIPTPVPTEGFSDQSGDGFSGFTFLTPLLRFQAHQARASQRPSPQEERRARRGQEYSCGQKGTLSGVGYNSVGRRHRS